MPPIPRSGLQSQPWNESHRREVERYNRPAHRGMPDRSPAFVGSGRKCGARVSRYCLTSSASISRQVDLETGKPPVCKGVPGQAPVLPVDPGSDTGEADALVALGDDARPQELHLDGDRAAHPSHSLGCLRPVMLPMPFGPLAQPRVASAVPRSAGVVAAGARRGHASRARCGCGTAGRRSHTSVPWELRFVVAAPDFRVIAGSRSAMTPSRVTRPSGLERTSDGLLPGAGEGTSPLRA
jgi:hypothetical protein